MSLLVPNVQELAKTKPTAVPPRYVRSDLPPPASSSSSSSIDDASVPIIDFQKLSDPNHADSELRLLHEACREWGFFQVTNHGVESGVVEKMKEEVEKFFHLPIDEKMRYSQKAGDVEGYGQAFVVSEDQKLDWADMFFALSLPENLRKPHLIPSLPSDFRYAVDSYSAEMKILGNKVVEAMERSLKLKKHGEMTDVFRDGTLSVRMNYYPPCPQPELVTGLTPHSDASGLTILLQVNDTPGLHVSKDGHWIPVFPLKNAFVVNIGDTLEMITNGNYKSVMHKANVTCDKERLSVAYFFTPKPDVEFGPSPSLVTRETPARFRKTTSAEYRKLIFSRELRGKSNLDTMRII